MAHARYIKGRRNKSVPASANEGKVVEGTMRLEFVLLILLVPIALLQGPRALALAAIVCGLQKHVCEFH